MLQKCFSPVAIGLSAILLTGCSDVVDKVAPSTATQQPQAASAPPEANAPPVIFGNPSQIATVGRAWSFTPSAADPDGDPITFDIQNQPPWASFDNSTGRLSGVPQLGQEGDYANIQIFAADGQTAAPLPGFTVTVQNISSNSAPQISGVAPSSVDTGQPYTFQPTAGDADGDALSFDIANRPTWASFDTSTGRLSGTPSEFDAGLYRNIVISVGDGLQSASLPSFAISVQSQAPTNSPPLISGAAGTTALVGQVYSFQPDTSDPDGDELTFAISNLPGWASFSSTAGTLSGTPTVGDEGLYQNIRIFVSDGRVTAELPGFSILVENPDINDPPQISGIPRLTVRVGEPYNFQPNAVDADGDPLRFAISNQPAWTTFDAATGRLSGTASDGEEGVYRNIVIFVSDGEFSASLPGFDITVAAADENQAPGISGSPGTSATVAQSYSFQPNASDPDGDDLTFAIANRPSWAAFNAGTGRLSGTPAEGDSAVYEDIQISVSDGDLSASLPAFTITVSQAATGSVTLTWTAPTRNTDGSPLNDLAAYKIYYGTSPGNYPNEVRIDNPGVTTYVIDNLAANTYYFVSTSINEGDVESDLSNEASKTVN